jgi:predicted lactoylglutathione lyase
MNLGAFSLSLNVKDLKKSKNFYEKIGFTVFGGNIEENYLIMKNENSLIGLFQGMFEKNVLTFNPGWDVNAETMNDFEDIRIIQKSLKDNGIKIETEEIDEKTNGPGNLMIIDPDGNPILIDQHI